MQETVHCMNEICVVLDAAPYTLKHSMFRSVGVFTEQYAKT
jgi:hypothetical protein